MKKLFFTILSLSFFGLAQAQDAAGSDASALESRVETLETRTSTWQKIAARLPKFSGYVQAGYRYSEDASTFFLRRVRLSLAGDILPKLDYRIQFEFCTPRLIDAYIRYRPFTQLGVKLGQYKVPFSTENTDYIPTRLEFVEYPLALQKLMGFSDVCGLSATGRDVGATLSGGFFKRDGYCIVNYDLGVFNGAGINTRDDNKTKDFVARLTIMPAQGLLLSGSYYWGEYGPSCFARERYSAGVCYDRGSVVVRGEWIGGRTGSAGGEFRSDGWYVVAGWRAPHHLTPVARVEQFTLDTSDRSACLQTNYTVGLLWTPVKFLRCQIDYTYEDYAVSSGRNVVAVMFTGMF